MPKKWIQRASKRRRKGALHRQLGVPLSEKIPKLWLHRIKQLPKGKKITVKGKRVTVTRLLKQRAVFALNAQKRK